MGDKGWSPLEFADSMVSQKIRSRLAVKAAATKTGTKRKHDYDDDDYRTTPMQAQHLFPSNLSLLPDIGKGVVLLHARREILEADALPVTQLPHLYAIFFTLSATQTI